MKPARTKPEKVKRGTIALGIGIVVGGLVAYIVGTREPVRASAAASGSASASAQIEMSMSAPAVSSVAPRVAAPATIASARWGSRRGELGRSRPTEGNPEGPMSFAVSGHALYVIDQVNGRMIRYDAHGKIIASSTIRETVQDVAIAKDGTVALLDRLGEKNVTLTDANGRRIGTLPLGTNEPGLLTGVFVDGNTVYVEQGHGGLEGVGTTDGQPLTSPMTLGGRPTKNGALLINATLAAPEGKLMINAIDRATAALRFARVIQMTKPSLAIVLLDSDDRGVVYAGVAAGSPESATVVCLDPIDGHVLGRVEVPLSSEADESFRDLAVDGDGTIVYALRTPDGVGYGTATCP